MKYIATIILLLYSLFSFSQAKFIDKQDIYYVPTNPEFISFNSTIQFISTQNTITFLEAKYFDTRFTGQKLELESVKNSPIGKHYRFKHIYQNMPVYQSFVQANYDQKGKLIMVVNGLAKFDDYFTPANSAAKGEIWMNTNRGITPSYVINRTDSLTDQTSNFYYSNENKLLLVFNPRLYFHGPDSMVSAMVYLPNPIIAAKANYGDKGYDDNNDKDSPELTAARSKVRVPLFFENGKFTLTDGTITIKNIHDPAIAPIQPTDTFLNYTRSQSGFEDINVFYHLNTYSNYLRKIGFEDLLDKIDVDSHGAGGEDNSFFDQGTFELEYGTGCVDDGEDGQVVLHEFGHSLSVVASSGTTQGTQRMAMEEGQADYVSMGYSRTLSQYKPNDVFSWDAHNECWEGFTVKSSLKYPKRTDIRDNDREIWSTALMCIYDKLGRTKSDSLIFSYYFLQASQSTMPQMAKVILKLDSVLYNGKGLGRIWQCFTDQEILDTVPRWLSLNNFENIEDQIKIYNSSDFSKGFGNAKIVFANPNIWSELEIYNSLGQKTNTIKISKETILLPEDFKSGVYYLKINAADGSVSFTKKIIRF